MSDSTRQRRREFGVRVALGATGLAIDRRSTVRRRSARRRRHRGWTPWIATGRALARSCNAECGPADGLGLAACSDRAADSGRNCERPPGTAGFGHRSAHDHARRMTLRSVDVTFRLKDSQTASGTTLATFTSVFTGSRGSTRGRQAKSVLVPTAVHDIS